MAGASERTSWDVHNGRFTVAAGALAAAVLGLAWLALADLIVDRGGAPTALDNAVLAFMVGHRYHLLTVLLAGITNAGGTLAMTVVTVVASGWLVGRRQWGQAALVTVTGLGSAVLVPLTKGIVGRVRPPTGDHLVVQTNPAFPSGHTLGSFTVIGVVTAIALMRPHTRRVRVAIAGAATLFVFAVGLSRLYLGVHWATDVIGGWLLGAAWLALCLTGGALLARARVPSE